MDSPPIHGKRRTFKTKCADFCRSLTAFIFGHVGICGLVVGYIIIGAFVFMAIEDDGGYDLSIDVEEMRKNLVSDLWEVTIEHNVFYKENWTIFVAEKVKNYQMTLIDAVSEGYDGDDSVTHIPTQWTFSGAFLYCLTVITTIGYGNIVPTTVFGKIATIFYAMVGMPIFLLYVSNIGDILATSFRWTYVKLCLCGGKKKRSPHGSIGSDLDQENIDPSTITVPITVSLCIMVGYVYGGAMLFMNWETWDILDSSYFCFISLSTIGFGDLVPGDSFNASEGVEPSLIFCSMYLIIGMALIAMCFNLMQEEVVAKVRRVMKAFGCIKDE